MKPVGASAEFVTEPAPANVMPVWAFEPEGGSEDALLNSATPWNTDLLVEALRVEAATTRCRCGPCAAAAEARRLVECRWGGRGQEQGQPTGDSCSQPPNSPWRKAQSATQKSRGPSVALTLFSVLKTLRCPRKPARQKSSHPRNP
jgi:hypothetical protein